jgi:hypothetical protein
MLMNGDVCAKAVVEDVVELMLIEFCDANLCRNETDSDSSPDAIR